ncbi:NTP transferase domain-containing protein [bacterium]|nr:NTP transferase domain-containing protein [bacterium]
MIVGAVLAGGLSRRMGSPKEGIPLRDGRPMIEHVLDAISPVCDRVAIVGECRGWDPSARPALRHLPDLHPGAGPLGAILTLLESGMATGYLVVTCDQPLLTAELLRTLVRSASASPTFFRLPSGEVLDPFPGYYPVEWLPTARSLFLAGERSPRKALRQSECAFVGIEADRLRFLKGFNTPEELRELTAQ